MRKFLVILLLPIFLKSVQVVSTENPVVIPKQVVYSLTHTPYHFSKILWGDASLFYRRPD